MTPDQYRREGAEAMQKAAAMYAECAPDRIPYRDHAGSFDWRDGLMDGARAAAEDIRAIDVDKVLAVMPPTDDAVAQLVEAARALGAMPEGYCFCSTNRIGDDSKVHDPECADLRATLVKMETEQCQVSIEPATGATLNGLHGSGSGAPDVVDNSHPEAVALLAEVRP